MPAPHTRRVWPLLAALVTLLGLVGTPGVPSAGHGDLAAAAVRWTADLTSDAGDAGIAGGSTKRALWSAPAARKAANPAKAVKAVNRPVPTPGNVLRPWLDTQPLLATGQHPRPEHQLLALGAVLWLLALSAAWLAVRPGPAIRAVRGGGGGPGARGPPGGRRPGPRVRPATTRFSGAGRRSDPVRGPRLRGA